MYKITEDIRNIVFILLAFLSIQATTSIHDFIIVVNASTFSVHV